MFYVPYKLRISLSVFTVLLFLFAFAGASGFAATFTNSTPIIIADDTTASPYGSIITVSGLSGTITTVKVTINGFSHTYPEDVGILLVGPTGAAYLLQDGAGNDPDMVNITYSLADGFPPLPPDTAWPAGTYKPVNYIGGDVFPMPAPSSYQNPGPMGVGTATFASVFNGTGPNGSWKLYVVDFAEDDTGQISGGWTIDITTNSVPVTRKPFDFDGDGKTDIGIYRPGPAEWWIQRSGDSSVLAAQFGSTTDVISPADFTGDGKTDIAFFRPSTGQWFVLRSEDLSFYGFPFGSNGDVPAPADYDGDGKADPAVYRPTGASWFILRSSDGGVASAQFGISGDKPVPADYDGDGKADIGIYRPSGGTGGEWWIQRSTAGLFAASFGNSADKTAQGDWTGDGKADCAFYRPSNGTWYVLRSEDQSFFGFPFGSSTDTPAPGDYDGDGKSDAGVFRQPGAQWFINRSSGGVTSLAFGIAGDQPVPGAYVR